MTLVFSILAPMRKLLNALLPFTDPSTPLLQDLIHTAVLCSVLYFAPYLTERYNSLTKTYQPPPPEPTSIDDIDELPLEEPPDDNPNIPHDVGVVVEPGDEEPIEPPPQAPTPPPFIQAPFPPEDPGVGPADLPNLAADRPRATPQNRHIGAKKAKSLARKDQRRAYHEFMRQQSEMRRAAEAEGAEEREALAVEERKRRAEVEKEIQERERAEREAKKAEEKRELEEERKRRERVVERVRQDLETQGCVNLEELAWNEGKDLLWIERLIKASGVLSQTAPGSTRMITGDGWVVSVDAPLMEQAYAMALSLGEENGGKIPFEDLGGIIKKVVMLRAKG